jgi:hypothetical protein
LELPNAGIRSPLSLPVNLLYAPLRESVLYYLKLQPLNCCYYWSWKAPGSFYEGPERLILVEMLAEENMKWWMLQRFKINCCVYMLFPPHNTLGD